MVRTPLALVLVFLAASVGGAQGGAQATVELALNPTGFGAAVTVTPSGLLTGCRGSQCFYKFEVGTVVTLSIAISSPGTTFATWRGSCGGSAATCTLTMDRSRSVTARFSPVRLYVDPPYRQGSVERSPGVSCGAGCTAYPYGARVSLVARGCCGYTFHYWSGHCAGIRSDGCEFNIFENVETSPVFRCAGSDCVGTIQQPLSRDVKPSVTVTGPGRVQINGKDCYTTCAFVFRRGQPVVLRAIANSSRFLSWSGSCRGSDPRCQFAAFNEPNGRPPSVRAYFGP